MPFNLNKLTELCVCVVAIAALMLAGCSGGRGGISAGVSSTPLSVIPGKGLMVGALVKVLAPVSGSIYATALTDLSGEASFMLPNTVSGPLLVSVTCESNCRYFDEASGSMVSGVNGISLLAMIPDLSQSTVGVTAATHAAAQLVMASGVPDEAGILAANATVGKYLGGISNILTPPRIIRDSTSLAAALSGSSDADRLASISAAIAKAASGVDAIQAIVDYGSAWRNALLNPGSGVILPTSIHPGYIVIAPSILPTQLNIDVASQYSINRNIFASGVAITPSNASQKIKTLIRGIALQAIASGVSPASAVAALRSAAFSNAVSQTVAANPESGDSKLLVDIAKGEAYGIKRAPSNFGDIVTRTNLTYANATNKFHYMLSSSELRSDNAWGAPTRTPGTVEYVLTSTGWLSNLSDQTGEITFNGNGTITTSNSSFGNSTVQVSALVLDGLPIENCQGVSCISTGSTYPIGSRRYLLNGGRSSISTYILSDGGPSNIHGVTNLNGSALNTLPSPGSSFCADGVYLTPKSSGSTAYDFSTLIVRQCTATNLLVLSNPILILMSVASSGGGDMTVNFATGNPVIPSLLLLSSTRNPDFHARYPNGMVLDVVDGAVRAGIPLSIGDGEKTFSGMEILNKTALNAELAAFGKALMP